LASITPPLPLILLLLLLLLLLVPSLEEEEEGKVAKAERAALKAGVSVRRWRARFTLSERTLVELMAVDNMSGMVFN